MVNCHKLAFAFESELLKTDLGKIHTDDWVPHFNRQYYEGEWKALALRSASGRANQIYQPPNEISAAIDTPVLARCPYFRQVLNMFECSLLAARLLSLGPGSKIREHEDYFLGFEYGLIRIHIPISTEPRVEFFVGNERLDMKEGEAWYIDFGLPHRINNLSDRDRVHLVVDCIVNDWLKEIIPFAPTPQA